MGPIYVDATIRNPADRSRSWRRPFLADTGAMNTVVPPECIEAVGLVPWGRRTHVLANGHRVALDVTAAEIEFMDDFVGGTVVVGEAGSEPLLGLTALQSMGVEVDVMNRVLRRLPAVRLKGSSAASPPSTIARIPYSMPISAQIVDKLGVRLYDRASAVIAELISNSYDADATEVYVQAPLGRYLATTIGGKLTDHDLTIQVSDDGLGMTPTEMEKYFLPVGTERRTDPHRGPNSGRFGRKVMGRKGVGKLAPFGICKVIEVRSAGGRDELHALPDGTSQRGYLTSHVVLKYDDIVALGREPSEIYRPMPGPDDCTVSENPGTTITLRDFYRKRIPDSATLTRQIAQRFGIESDNWRIVVADSAPNGQSEPRVVGHFDVQTMPGTKLTFHALRQVLGPDDGAIDGAQAGFLKDNRFYSVTGWMAYSKLPYKDDLMAGVRIYCRGKIASQTSLFNRRAGFTGEYNIRSYLVGELHADWLDDEEDLILTDRRDILWSHELGEQFQKWGQDMVLKIGTLARDPMRKATLDIFLETGNVEDYVTTHFADEQDQDIRSRALRLAKMLGRTMNRAEAQHAASVREVVDLAILLAPHVTLNEMMKQASVDADTPLSLLGTFLRTARIAEACSFGRIAGDRVRVIHSLRKLINSDSPEADLQDLIKNAPWLINPEWAPVAANQTFATVRRQFLEYYSRYIRRPPHISASNKRPDFVLIGQGNTIHLVEIKAPGYVLAGGDLRRIVTYYDCMDDFLTADGNEEFRDRFSGGFHITLVCDKVRLQGYDARALEGIRDRLTHVTWSVFLSRTERIHREYLRTEKFQTDLAPAGDI